MQLKNHSNLVHEDLVLPDPQNCLMMWESERNSNIDRPKHIIIELPRCVMIIQLRDTRVQFLSTKAILQHFREAWEKGVGLCREGHLPPQRLYEWPCLGSSRQVIKTSLQRKGLRKKMWCLR